MEIGWIRIDIIEIANISNLMKIKNPSNNNNGILGNQ